MYQRTLNRGLIFYSLDDYLVFFTIFCSQAKQQSIRVLALCPMLDHIHQVVVAENEKQLAVFIQRYARLFAWEWNRRRGKKGSLFQHRFGSAVKLGNKQVRTALAYCNNNPVERRLTEMSEEYRWTFLAYHHNKNPYSCPLNLSRSGSYLKSVLHEINTCFHSDSHLRYAQLERWEKHLSTQQWLQVTDYIIGLWNIIDYGQAISYYGSFETMIRAFHDNTGSEYDIKEDHDNYSDTVYADCTRIVLSEGLVNHISDIPTLPDDLKWELFALLQSRTSARPRQLRKYLHIAI